jgi:hypothetical protein
LFNVLVAVAINFLINRLADFMFDVLFDISIDSSVDVFFVVLFESEQGDILVEGTTSGDELSASDDIRRTSLTTREDISL